MSDAEFKQLIDEFVQAGKIILYKDYMYKYSDCCYNVKGLTFMSKYVCGAGYLRSEKFNTAREKICASVYSLKPNFTELITADTYITAEDIIVIDHLSTPVEFLSVDELRKHIEDTYNFLSTVELEVNKLKLISKIKAI